jgi:transposase
VITVLKKIPIDIREKVLEVTLDMSNAMDSIIKGSFPKVTIVTDRFHVQQLVSEAVQEIRIFGYPFKAGRFGVGRVLYGAKFN